MTRKNAYTYVLPFEQPVVDLEKQIVAMETRGDAGAYAEELDQLRESRDSMLTKIYGDLSPWDTVRVARHPDRPQSGDYVQLICRDFRELHGDRHFGDDPAIITGLARIGSHKVMLVGHQKGRSTAEKIACHFGWRIPRAIARPCSK